MIGHPRDLRRPLTLALVLAGPLLAFAQAPAPDALPFRDPDLPLEQRVDDLLSRLTLEEKVSLMIERAEPVERLGIPEYNWWNEALHGVARAGRATVFPQAIGLAATWDTDLMLRVATGDLRRGPGQAQRVGARRDSGTSTRA